MIHNIQEKKGYFWGKEKEKKHQKVSFLEQAAVSGPKTRPKTPPWPDRSGVPAGFCRMRNVENLLVEAIFFSLGKKVHRNAVKTCEKTIDYLWDKVS